MRQMPKQQPGKSKQDYRTPKILLAAVKKRLGIREFDVDLAADWRNRVCNDHYTKENSSLRLGVRWRHGKGWAWLNPPFDNITAFLARAEKESQRYGARIAVLVPASTGANWWRDYVHGQTIIFLLNGRVTFDDAPINPKTGKPDPYPKDCAVILFGSGLPPNYYVWDWMRGKEYDGDGRSW